MARAESLFRLQLIDSDLDAARKRVKEIDAALTGSPAVNHARAQLAEIRKARLEAAAALKFAELDVQALDEKLKAEEQRLYAGLIKSPKEMVDTQHEIESLKRRRAEAEERELITIDQHDTAQADEARCEAALKEALAHFEGDSVSLRQERAKLAAHFNSQVEMRNASVAGLPKGDLEAYMAVRTKKPNGVAVAMVKNDACGQCGQELSSQLLQVARVGTTFAYCPSCGRILRGL